MLKFVLWVIECDESNEHTHLMHACMQGYSSLGAGVNKFFSDVTNLLNHKPLIQ